jgi:hypothetical protein
MKVTDLTELVVASPNDVIPIVDVSEDITKKLQINNLPVPTGVQTALNDKEDLSNKSTSVTTDQASNTKYPSVKAVYDWAVGLFATLSQLATKQDTLVSGTNIKTVNSTSLLGSGDIPIPIVNPSGVAGSIQFSDGSAFSSDATNLFWDNTNKRLGVGTNAPSARIHSSQLFGASSLSQLDRFGLFVGYSSATFGIAVGGSSVAGAGAIQGTNATGNATGKLSLNPLGGNVSVGQVASGGGLAMLEVRGSGSTSATTALLVQNSAGDQILRVRDDTQVQLGSSSNFTVDGNTTFNRYELVVGALSSIPSAILSATSTTRGFLPPRMTTTQKNAISSPASGLQVYDTTLNQMSYYNGSSWINF